MTHTLHRTTDSCTQKEDLVILSMATQGYNDKGAGEKLKEIFRLAAETEPDNLADDNLGSRFTGYTDQQILDNMGDKAYIGVAFSDPERLKNALIKIKKADLGMSVVVSGPYQMVFDLLREIGLKPHTVNMSLGIFGKQTLLPRPEVLAMATMCGHGMVPPRRIENIMQKVAAGELDPDKGGIEMAHTCTCGIFNPRLAGCMLARQCPSSQSSQSSSSPKDSEKK